MALFQDRKDSVSPLVSLSREILVREESKRSWMVEESMRGVLLMVGVGGTRLVPVAGAGTRGGGGEGLVTTTRGGEARLHEILESEDPVLVDNWRMLARFLVSVAVS
jgi:hypothetical protein